MEDEVTSNEVWFIGDLPECCAGGRLRLPRPVEVRYKVAGGDMDFGGGGEGWVFGLDEWRLSVGVSWEESEENLVAALEGHHGLGPDVVDPDAVLAAHGVVLDRDGVAWVGHATVHVANLSSDLNEASGREAIGGPADLWEAADAATSDLETLVEPLVDLRAGTWSKDVVKACPDVDSAFAVILLRSVRVTPVLRGFGLGAWAAARAVGLFDQGFSLVATYAAPLERADAIAGYVDQGEDLTPGEERKWQAEQERLAAHWERTLGLVPLTSERNVLVWHSAEANDEILEALRAWA